MIFTFLISIVFIAELIIAAAILLNLKRLGKAVRNLDLTVNYLKPSLKEVCVLARKISAQVLEITEDFVERQKDSFMNHIARVILSALFLRRFRKSKAFKLISKGLSILEIVV